MTFFKNLIKELIEEGHTVDIICNETDEKVPDCYREWNCNIFHHSCSRSPLSAGNIKAIKEIKDVVAENKYDIVHCHTPIAAMCTRLACRGLRKNGVKVIYTAHGFHFYKGAPKLNWLIYYPIEKVCARFTDVLITINHEDYELAKRKMKAKRVEYVPGVGIDVDKFKNTVVDRAAKRKELGIPEDAFLLVSVGELNANKNHEVILKAMAQIDDDNIHYAIAGVGELKDYLLELASKLGIAERFHLLGYRNDVAEIYKAAEVFCFPSFREGLPVSLMEAMAAGLCTVAAKNRGTIELIRNNGVLCNHNEADEFSEKIKLLANNQKLMKEFGVNGQSIVTYFRNERVNKLVTNIYCLSRRNEKFWEE